MGERPTALLLLTMLASPAWADTIHLKSGGVIHTDSVRIDSDRVYFEQYGARVAIPLEIVERIVEDDLTGPTPTVRITRETSGSGRRASASLPGRATGRSSAEPTMGEPMPGMHRGQAPGSEREVDSSNRSVCRQDERPLLTRDFLRRAEAAFLFSHRSTTEVKQRIRAVGQGRSGHATREDLQSTLAFLRRAERAFLFSHRSTTEVKQRIRAVTDGDRADRRTLPGRAFVSRIFSGVCTC